MNQHRNQFAWIHRASTIPWWVWFAAIHIFFISITFLIPYLPKPFRSGFIHHFDLAIEMNIAAWWSGINLIALSLLAYERFSTRHDRTKPAWLVLSFILFLLSLDEISSLHERAGGLKALLPYIAAFVLLLAYSLLLLYFKIETRIPAIWIGMGFALFGTTVFQERLEHSIQWPAWATGIRVGVEEGSELLGILLIMMSLVAERQKEDPDRSLLAAIPNPFRLRFLPAILGGGLLLHSIFSLLVAPQYAVSNLGNPVVWYPATLFFILFSIASWRSLQFSNGSRLAWLSFAAFNLLNSLAAIYIVSPRQEFSGVYSLGWITNFYIFSTFQVVVIALFYLVLSRSAGKRRLPVFAVLIMLLALGLLVKALALQFLIAGILVLSVDLLFYSEIPQPSPRISEDMRSIPS